jgi:hypothetical protein
MTTEKQADRGAVNQRRAPSIQEAAAALDEDGTLDRQELAAG